MPLIRGTAGRDSLRGTNGRDTIHAMHGNDTIDPGRGPDRVHAGSGADVVYWDQDPLSRGVVDAYVGGQMHETYDPNPYMDRLGGDRLVLGHHAGQHGFRVTFTSSEDGQALDAWGNRLTFQQFERLTTGSGNDVINGALAVLEPERGEPGTVNHVPVHGLDITAGAGNDIIIGSRGNDVIDGGPGNDTIYGGEGSDFIQSSTGNDLIYGGGGIDNIRWGRGNETERVGHDTIYGGETGERGSDILNMWVRDWDGNGVSVTFNSAESGWAMTTVGGGLSTVRFYEFESFWTHEGNDTINGSSAVIGPDNRGVHVNGRWGNDRITGTQGNDTIEGGEGADTLDGGRGNDFISMVQDFYLPLGSPVQPDAQRDVLVVRDGAGFDTIRAFQVGDVRDASGHIIRHGDALNLQGLHDAQGNPVDINDVRVTEIDGHAVLNFPNGERVMLENIRAASLTRPRLIELGLPRPGNPRANEAEAQAAQDAPPAQDVQPARPEAVHGGDEVLARPDQTVRPEMQLARAGARADDPAIGVTCFTAGTLIETPDGPMQVQMLQPGDLVLTRDHGPRPLRWIGRRLLSAAELRLAPQLNPIRIRTGALGQGVPQRDLTVSPQHRVLVRSAIARRMFGADEVLVAAKQLLALDGIEQLQVAQVEYVHILFDGHEIVASDGAWTESLYTGAEALKSLGQAARDEIFALFPELQGSPAPAARPFATGARARQLAARHQRNGKALVSA
ncbi:Hint domain-containing protein [Paracoccus laeviglucosivorans]|uniref:Ca2+-binding protein, RTX toxin-related n=1 Tax=Paracoccus laeviglucosivorans TaxID=1197861 RepID=A0A521DAR0_9RHOB|nr:Hint domain-containing protein [Paracoccus laeviglucosivorans]SMO68804.1 Ca2+-binding protein, RTX toxin-related [Paracoccus laeviglucosivorans]